MSSSDKNQTTGNQTDSNKQNSTKTKQQADKKCVENDFLNDHLQSHDHRASNSQAYKNTNMSSKQNHKITNEKDENMQKSSRSPPPNKSKNMKKVYNEDGSLIISKPFTSRRSKLLSTSSSTGATVNCICCLHELQTYVYYSCMHFVCLNCSIKIRVICQKTDCPICRQESPQVLCTKRQLSEKEVQMGLDILVKSYPSVIKSFSSLKPLPSSSIPDLSKDEYLKIKKSGIHFDQDQIKEEYNEILTSECGECTEDFKCFDDLENHVRRVHKKFYCELCLNNLKLFPYERKYYNREDLANHKRKGDKGDHAFKGHPICSYCDQRFFDRDELYRHFRRDHYYCHFCDSDGNEEYYNDYAELRSHFLKAHYLCELDTCSQNAAQTHEYVVFRNDLDLQAHKKQTHAKSKSEAKNFGKINIEFSMSRNTASGYSRDSRENSNQKNQKGKRQPKNQTEGERFSQDQTTSTASAIDPNVLQMSKAQYMRDEEDRNRQKQLQTLKEQYEKYEQENPELSIKKDVPLDVKIEPTKSELTSQTSVENDPASAPIWRNVIGQGNAPKINKLNEFPSLISDRPSVSNISSPFKKQTQDVWGTTKKTGKTPHAAPEFTVKQSLSKKQAKKLKAQQEQNELNELNKTLELSKISPSLDSQNTVSSSIKTNENTPMSTFQNSNNNDENDFPSLSNSSEIKTKGKTSPPPGFNARNVNIGSPPGFETASLQNESQSSYIKPQNYLLRDQNLKKDLTEFFGIYNEVEFEKFKDLSIKFQINDIGAKEYLKDCRKLLEFQPDSVKFFNYMQEMIVLLPDLTKQQELYLAFEELIETEKKNKTRGNRANNEISNKLEHCQFCSQYFHENELNYHQKNHHKKNLAEYYSNKSPIAVNKKKVTQNKPAKSIEEDFPSLLASAPKTSNQPKTFKESYVFAKKTTQKSPEPLNSKKSNINDFPTLGESIKPSEAGEPQYSNSIREKPKEKKKEKEFNAEEDFPSLGSGQVMNSAQRFSSMPTQSIFSNPSSHLSVLNKKKHRLQK